MRHRTRDSLPPMDSPTPHDEPATSPSPEQAGPAPAAERVVLPITQEPPTISRAGRRAAGGGHAARDDVSDTAVRRRALLETSGLANAGADILDSATDQSGEQARPLTDTSGADESSAASPAPALASEDASVVWPKMASAPEATTPGSPSPETPGGPETSDSIASEEKSWVALRSGADSESKTAPDSRAASKTTSASARNEDEVILEGSSVVGQPPSRAATHWAGVLVAIAALPVSWYFLHSSAAHMRQGVEPFALSFSPGGFMELIVGTLALLAAMWMARSSSLGPFVVGAISVVLGLPFLLAPHTMASALGPIMERLTIHSDLGANLASFVWSDALSGHFLAFGLFMILVGVVSHSARQAGRREQEIIDRARHD